MAPQAATIDFKKLFSNHECVLSVQLEAYKEAYDLTESRLDSFFRKIQEYFGPGVANNFQLPQNNAVDSVSKCPFCSKPMAVNTNNAGKHFIGCTGYPECKTSGYFPSGSYLKDRGDPCRRCGEGYYRCIIYFPPNSAPPQMTGDYQGCFKCDCIDSDSHAHKPFLMHRSFETPPESGLHAWPEHT